MTAASDEFQNLPTALDALIEGVQVIDREFRYRYVNAAAARHGRSTPEALRGRTMTECYPGIEHSELFAQLQRCMNEHVAHVMENPFAYPDGSLAHFELRIEPVPDGLCILSIDVTARKAAEREARDNEDRMRHAQRLEAVGQLAAGVAHDFNNLLSVILGHAEIASTRPDGPDGADIAAITAAARRAADVTRQLLAYGRRRVMLKSVVDPAALIADLESMMRGALGRKVELVAAPSGTVGRIEVDPTLLEQALVNLVLNARDAMPAGGRITIIASDIDLDEAYAQLHPEVVPGPHVVISVSDTGIGMDRETLQHIFEPFFTTKEKGRGSGLGLSTVHGIVKQSGGHIWTYSEPGHGTTFKIYFPRLDGVAVGPPPRQSAPPGPVRANEGETVLFVDDDPMLRRLGEVVLRNGGFRVLAADSGDAALAVARREPRVDVLVTDMTMPRMNGRELIEEMAALRPEVKILCTSGLGAADAEVERILGRRIAFLEKPFVPSVLLRRIREVIDDPS